MTNTIEDIINRRSIRKYSSKQILKEELDSVLLAGTCAPSGHNRQSSIIIAVQNKEDISLMSKLNSELRGINTDPYYGAPTVLVVLSDATSVFAVQDGSLVMGNLMNAAYSIGLGSCWINRTKEVFELPEGKELLKKWGIIGDYIGIASCILGYPLETPKIKKRKEKYIYFVP